MEQKLKHNLKITGFIPAIISIIINFIELYLDGKEVRIIDRMDNLKVNVFR
jgi:hypothetical protein